MSAQHFEGRLSRLEGAYGQVADRLNSIDAGIAGLRHDMTERFGQLDGCLGHIEQRFGQIDQRLGQIDQRFAQIDQRFGQIDQRFGQIDQRFGQIDQRFGQIDQRFMWVIGLIVTSWTTTILTVLLHHG